MKYNIDNSWNEYIERAEEEVKAIFANIQQELHDNYIKYLHKEMKELFENEKEK